MKTKQGLLSIREIAIFGMMGGLMYASKLLMEALPNIHLIGVFIIALTVVYRGKALYPLYIFIFLTGLLNGFSKWWYPYLYIWLPLWGATMLLPKNMPKWLAPIVYCLINALHGISYGTLYAPSEVILYHMKWSMLPAWILAGLPFDVMHSLGNLGCGILIVPLINVIRLGERLTKEGK